MTFLHATFALAFLVAPGLADFNCSRLGQPCNNGGLCEGGMCVCQDATFTGYDCSQNTQYINQGECQFLSPCLNGGTCYDMAGTGTTATTIVTTTGTPGTPQCYCPYGFYGERCEMPSVFNECFNDQMVVNVNPGPDFVGVVGVRHKTGICDLSLVSAQMEFTLDPARSKWQGYAGFLPFTGAACGNGPSVNITTTDITYTYDVLIRYDTSGATPELDEVVPFSCTVPNTAGLVPTGTVFAKEATPVVFSVSDARGAYLNNPKLGSPFTISFKADRNSMYTDVLVRSCMVFNSKRTMSQQVVRDSCPVAPMGRGLEKLGNEHVLTLVTHVFPGDPSLLFDCDVKVCKPGDFSCANPPFCLAVSPTAGGPSQVGTSDLLGLLSMDTSSATGGSNVLSSLFSSGGGGATASGGGASLTDIFSTFGGGAPTGGGANSVMDMSATAGTGASSPLNNLLLDGPVGGFFGTGGGTMMGRR